MKSYDGLKFTGMAALIGITYVFYAFTLSDHVLSKESAGIIDWSSSERIERLEASEYKVDFFKIANHFESQSNKLFCGAASAAIILNALRIGRKKTELPKDDGQLTREDRQYLPSKKGWSPSFSRYTQDNIFLKSPKSRLEVLGKPITVAGQKISDFGFQIRQLGALLEAHGLNVNLRIVDARLGIENFKKAMIENLASQGDYIIANYHRKVLGQEGEGHISPVGAYDKDSDSFLIMDVNPNNASWIWVDADLFIKAMGTFDTVEHRGFVLVSETIKSI